MLWRLNWTKEAEKVLLTFEKDVIKKVKAEGYDGQSGEESTQWNFSGALLYSVTIITTIGETLSEVLSFNLKKEEGYATVCYCIHERREERA